MSHLGQRLSALIDGELGHADRDRVLVHLARCEACRAEAVALRMLKRRMNALGGAAADSPALPYSLRRRDRHSALPLARGRRQQQRPGR